MKENVIVKIEKGSIAEELGLEPGDIILSINGEEVKDVFDYKYLINDEFIELLIKSKQGEEVIAEVEKDYDEDLGIIFDSGLMDEGKSCTNKCIFCFIDQLPKGMRETLYFKDDDSRLSFLQGNYVTLTNMKKADLERIIYYHLSPINISVHTTDLDLRVKMLKNKNAVNLLEYMEMLKNAGIEMNLQIVLCKNVNDGKVLEKTIEDLAAFFPNGRSLSVVPIGMTKYRDGLEPVEPFTKEDSIKIIETITKAQQKYKKELGSSFVFLADEFYLKAEMNFPPYDAYEDFPQIENGVGMIANLEQEFSEHIEKINAPNNTKKVVSIATGKAAFEFINSLCKRIMVKYPNITVNVYKIENNFFGEMITVSGLLCGCDIIEQLKDKNLGEYLCLPENLLRSGETTLLDNVTIEDIEKELKIKIKISKECGESFINTILA